MTKEKLVCSKCGGTNIQIMGWLDANTNEFISDIEDTDKWCEDCEENVDFVFESEYKIGK
jgi:hypothetical protein